MSTNHYFNINVADKFGIEAAILIQNLKFWIEHNMKQNINYYDGKFWMYSSYRELAQCMPYVSEQRVGRILRKLEMDKHLIKSANYNKSRYDKTKWYAFTDEGWSMIRECYIDDSEWNNRKKQDERPIQHNKTNEKSNNIDISGQATSFDVDAFYNASVKNSMLKMDEETKHNT